MERSLLPTGINAHFYSAIHQIIDEGCVMHHSNYMVGCLCGYYGIMSREKSFTYHKRVVVDIQQYTKIKNNTGI